MVDIFTLPVNILKEKIWSHCQSQAVRSHSPSLIATYGQYYGVGENGLVCYIFEICLVPIQILCETKLLPGILLRNKDLSFVCEWSNLKVNNNSIFTNKFENNEIIKIPISHGEGNFQADERTINELEEENRVIFRYCSDQGETNLISNPNGSINNIAGIINKQGNVLGMMPHPEKACEKLIGGIDGLGIFESVIKRVTNGN